jgi:hypothetical protein
MDLITAKPEQILSMLPTVKQALKEDKDQALMLTQGKQELEELLAQLLEQNNVLEEKVDLEISSRNR